MTTQIEAAGWTLLDKEVPTPDEIVWCLREWTPDDEPNTPPQREVVLAYREHGLPASRVADPRSNDWWRSVPRGSSWSDVTVLAWQALTAPAVPSDVVLDMGIAEVGGRPLALAVPATLGATPAQAAQTYKAYGEDTPSAQQGKVLSEL